MKNKIFAYAVLTLNAVAAWIAWAVLAAAIYGKTEHVWLYPILAFSFWGILFTLAAIFVRSKKYFHPSLAAGALGYPVFFGLNFSTLGIFVTLLLLVLTESQAKKEIDRGIKIDFYHLVSHTLKYFVTTVCLATAIAYYFSIAEKPSPSPTLLEKRTLETEMDWSLKAAGLVLAEDKKKMIEDITANETVDEFLSKNFVDPQINESMTMAKSIAPGGPIEAAKLIGDTTAVQIREEMLAKSKRDLAKQLGVGVVGEQPMKEVLTAYIEKTQKSFFEYSGSDKFYIPLILAFGLFLTARVLGTAIDIFLGLMILGIIKLLRVSGVVSVRQEQKEVAVIEYSI